MPEIKVRFTDSDLARLTAEAAAAMMPRAQLIRERALATPDVARLSTVEYHCVVADAAAFMRGTINRQHVETLVAYVFNRLARQAGAGDQPAA